MMGEHIRDDRQIVSLATNLKVFLTLLALLGLTLLVARFDLGPFNLAIALVVAAAKTLLIALYFMHLRRGWFVIGQHIAR